MGLSVRLFDPYGYAFKARNRTFGMGSLNPEILAKGSDQVVILVVLPSYFPR